MTNINPSNFLFGERKSSNNQLEVSEEENFNDLIDNYEDELNIRLAKAKLVTPKISSHNTELL